VREWGGGVDGEEKGERKDGPGKIGTEYTIVATRLR